MLRMILRTQSRKQAPTNYKLRKRIDDFTGFKSTFIDQKRLLCIIVERNPYLGVFYLFFNFIMNIPDTEQQVSALSGNSGYTKDFQLSHEGCDHRSTPEHEERQWQDVWNAMRTERHFDSVYWMQVVILKMLDAVFRHAGIVLVSFATALIAFIAWIVLIKMLPRVAQLYSLWWTWNMTLGVFLLSSIYFNYCMAVFTPPGNSKDITHSIDKIYSFPSDCPDLNSMLGKGLLQNCNKCRVAKPPRSHHCRVCKSCVLKMDHHCPWINNCVGHGNYRYFFSFMFYIVIATTYIAAVLTPYVWGSKQTLDKIYSQDPKVHSNMHISGTKIMESLGSPVQHFAFDEGIVSKDIAHRHLAVVHPLPKGIDASHVVHLSDDTPAQSHDISVESQHAPLEEDASKAAVALEASQKEEDRTLKGPLIKPSLQANPSLLTDEEKMAITRIVSEVTDDKNAAISFDSDKSLYMMWLVCSGLVLCVGSLCSFHFYLILNNLTTLELFVWARLTSREAKHWHNPYDMGSKMANFCAVFGSGKWYFALLPSLRKPPPLKVSSYMGPRQNIWDSSWLGTQSAHDA